MKPKPINTLALWVPMKDKGLSIKAFDSGYPYSEKGIIVRSDIGNPVTRYAKNYTKDNKEYSLCIITTETNINAIESWLDKQAEKIRSKDIEDGFKLLDVTYSVK